MIKFILNNELVETTLPANLVLLDYLRQYTQLTGTKESCHQGECGACLVLFGHLKNDKLCYQAVNSCLLPLGELQGSHIVTIEGLNQEQLNPIQQAFVEHGAVQCGYCTSGFIIALTEFLLNAPSFTLDEAKLSMSNNLCRCTGYQGIKRAILDLISKVQTGDIAFLVSQKILPEYFLEISKRLKNLAKLVSLPVKNSIAVGGGTDFFVQHHQIKTPLEFLDSHNELKGIHIKDNYCYLGAETTVEELRHSSVLKSLLPSLEEDLKLFAAKPLRQRATLAGNLVNASPIADLSIIFLALDTKLDLVAEHKRHELWLKEFFISYKHTAIQEHELIETVKIPLPLGLFHYQKVSKRQHLDIASVNSAIQLQVKDNHIQQAHLAVGGVAAAPLYLKQSIAFLKNQPITIETIKHLLKTVQAEISPISDIRGSCDYKRLLLQQIIIGHFLQLFPQQIDWQALQIKGVLS